MESHKTVRVVGYVVHTEKADDLEFHVHRTNVVCCAVSWIRFTRRLELRSKRCAFIRKAIYERIPGVDEHPLLEDEFLHPFISVNLDVRKLGAGMSNDLFHGRRWTHAVPSTVLIEFALDEAMYASAQANGLALGTVHCSWRWRARRPSPVPDSPRPPP